MTQLIGVMLTLTLRWPIWVASAFAIVLYAAFGTGWRLWMYPAMPVMGTLFLAALDWAAFSVRFERLSPPIGKFVFYLAIESVLSAFVCGAAILAFR